MTFHIIARCEDDIESTPREVLINSVYENSSPYKSKTYIRSLGENSN